MWHILPYVRLQIDQNNNNRCLLEAGPSGLLIAPHVELAGDYFLTEGFPGSIPFIREHPNMVGLRETSTLDSKGRHLVSCVHRLTWTAAADSLCYSYFEARWICVISFQGGTNVSKRVNNANRTVTQEQRLSLSNSNRSSVLTLATSNVVKQSHKKQTKEQKSTACQLGAEQILTAVLFVLRGHLKRPRRNVCFQSSK